MSTKYRINPKIKMDGVAVGEHLDPISVTPSLPSVDNYVSYLQEMQESYGFSGLSGGMKDYYTLTAYASIYTKVSDKMKSIITAVDQMRNFYLVDVMLSQIADDALAPKMSDDEIIKFSSDNKQIQKELSELKKRIGLDQLIENITPDLLAYGEYTLATIIGATPEVVEDELNTEEDDEKPKKRGKKRRGKKFKPNRVGKGILDVTDIVDQGTVIALTQDGKTEGYLVLNERGQVESKEVADYIKFQLGGTRVRIDINQVIPAAARLNTAMKKIIDKIPRFLRVGKSVLYSILPKLKELELLEKLVPATKLNTLSQGNLVGMSLPENYDLEMAMKASRRVEGMINKKVSVDPVLKEITVEAILSTAGRTRVIPMLGDKGSLQNLDYKSDAPDDLLNSANDIRKLILDSVGIPAELVFSSDGDGKAEILKRYAKYLRKLKRVQKAIALGCKQIAFIHLANKGIKFKEEEIDIVFNNNLVEIDNLDKLEHADVTINLLGNIRDFFNDMVEESSPYSEMVNLDKVAVYLEDNLKTVGLADAIKTPEEGGAGANPDAVKADGMPDDNSDKPEPKPKKEPKETTDDEDDGAEKVKEKE